MTQPNNLYLELFKLMIKQILRLAKRNSKLYLITILTRIGIDLLNLLDIVEPYTALLKRFKWVCLYLTLVDQRKLKFNKSLEI